MPCRTSHASISEQTKRKAGSVEAAIELYVSVRMELTMMCYPESTLVQADAVKAEGGSVSTAVNEPALNGKGDPDGVRS